MKSVHENIQALEHKNHSWIYDKYKCACNIDMFFESALSVPETIWSTIYTKTLLKSRNLI